MSMAHRTIKMAAAYWDKGDPANEGWAYRLRFSDNTSESGPMNSVDDADVKAELDALIAAAGGSGESRYRDFGEGSFYWATNLSAEVP